MKLNLLHIFCLFRFRFYVLVRERQQKTKQKNNGPRPRPRPRVLLTPHILRYFTLLGRSWFGQYIF